MSEYKKFDRKAAYIVGKLKDHVLYNGYHENLGDNEQRKFADQLAKSSLSYAEKYQLKNMLRISIENI